MERVIIDSVPQKYIEESLERYRFARNYIFGTVLDAACGMGYGCPILAEKADRVIGIDYSQEAIEGAKQYNRENKKAEFVKLDLDKDILPNFDCAVSFETIEHLKNPKYFLNQVFEKAKIFVFSVPLRAPSKYHLTVFNNLSGLLNLFGRPKEEFHFFGQKKEEGDCKIYNPLDDQKHFYIAGLWKRK